jgi:hypothetical protein
MAAFPGSERPREPEDFAPRPPELGLFARIEGLVGEEAALLRIPHHQRDREQRERLHAIADELDRIWDKLRSRAEAAGGASR